MLLRFRTENHRSFKGSAELSLVASGMRGAVPPDGDWIKATTRVAGIYGANASGKSTLLNAIEFMQEAVRYSATRWGERKTFPRHPFALDSESAASPSAYELDFVHEGVRHNYGFSSDSAGVREEWLYAYYTNRRSMLFERAGGQESKFTFGRSLPGENVTISKLVRPGALFLSVAANVNHPALFELHRYILWLIGYARYGEFDQSERLRVIRHALSDMTARRRVGILMRFADVGISGVELEKREMDPGAIESMKKVFAALESETGSPATPSFEDFLEGERNVVEFRHMAADGAGVKLPIEVESDGTVAWLSLAAFAIEAIRVGAVFLVHEIDSSLHPRLTATLIRMFKDSEINRSGAQLIFTSHDAIILGNVLGDVLSPDEVWFTEKRSDGCSELYSLSEFPVRTSDNFERRYLQGRYGAVPVVDFTELRQVLKELSTKP